MWDWIVVRTCAYVFVPIQKVQADSQYLSRYCTVSQSRVSPLPTAWCYYDTTYTVYHTVRLVSTGVSRTYSCTTGSI